MDSVPKLEEREFLTEQQDAAEGERHRQSETEREGERKRKL